MVTCREYLEGREKLILYRFIDSILIKSLKLMTHLHICDLECSQRRRSYYSSRLVVVVVATVVATSSSS